MRTIPTWAIAGLGAVLMSACGADAAVEKGLDDGGGGSAGEGPEVIPDDGSSGSSGASEQATCASFVKGLMDCNIVQGMRFKGCADDNPTLQCIAACVDASGCEVIKATYCFHASTGYADCLQACKLSEKPPDFVCGDGSTVPAKWQCDGAVDCPGGEDEACPDGTFSCEGGPSVPAGWRCDGIDDCPGGDDETDCGAPITCDDGTTLPSSKECNGVADCSGAEDELDCTRLICT